MLGKHLPGVNPSAYALFWKFLKAADSARDIGLPDEAKVSPMQATERDTNGMTCFICQLALAVSSPRALAVGQ